ncbi:group II intron maturase-specific domain-containing protein [Nonomuraea sp. B12E4]|uniref:group II intron maturase-specific domain-containing protein n=1 Tax=Nonomuraea sp. B12E4 TaxID=3153564 RepID=UPI00325F12BB
MPAEGASGAEPPSKRAIQAIKDKVKDRTRRAYQDMRPDELLISLNRTLRGWANYFRHGVSKAIFGAIDNHAWRRIVSWIFRKHSRISWQQLIRRFCLPGTWKLACNGVEFTGASSVKVTRYRYRGSKIPTPWSSQPASAVAVGG